MVMWVFGYGSLIWKAGFPYDNCLVGFIKDYRRVFHQGSTDHRGTPEYPGRTVTLEAADGEFCWGVAYKISKKEDEEIALTMSLLVLGERLSKLIDEDRAKIRFKSYLSCNNPRKPLFASWKLSFAAKYLEVREKQYDKKAYLDFFTEPTGTTPAVSGVMVYIASPDKKLNKNYLGPASLEEIAKQIIHAEGPSGPNREYLFQLEKALLELGCKDGHVMDLANEVRRILSERELTG